MFLLITGIAASGGVLFAALFRVSDWVQRHIVLVWAGGLAPVLLVGVRDFLAVDPCMAGLIGRGGGEACGISFMIEAILLFVFATSWSFGAFAVSLNRPRVAAFVRRALAVAFDFNSGATQKSRRKQ